MMTNRSRATLVACIAAAAIAVAGCPEDPPADPAPPAPGRAEPTEMRTIEVTEAKVAQGRGLFATCAACHGEEGRGKIGQGPALNSESFLAAASDAFLVRTITHGRAGTTMVAWGNTYDEAQVESLVAYIRSLQDVPAAELDESALEGDVAAGQRLYAEICAACHGRTGAGYQETSNGTGIGRRAFLDSVTDGYLRYIIEHGKENTRMRPMTGDSPVAVADLTDEEIDNIIAYLRDHAW